MEITYNETATLLFIVAWIIETIILLVSMEKAKMDIGDQGFYFFTWILGTPFFFLVFFFLMAMVEANKRDNERWNRRK